MKYNYLILQERERAVVSILIYLWKERKPIGKFIEKNKKIEKKNTKRVGMISYFMEW